MLIRTIYKTIVWLALGLGLAACAAPTPSPGAPGSTADSAAAATPTLLPAGSLPDMGAAPAIVNRVWLNTEEPLSATGPPATCWISEATFVISTLEKEPMRRRRS